MTSTNAVLRLRARRSLSSCRGMAWIMAAISSLQQRRRLEAVVRRRRRQVRPVQAVRPLPWKLRCGLAAAQGLQHDVQEEDLGEPEAPGADGGDHVEVGELQGVVRD